MVGLLNEMNDGVKQVLLLGETAHAPLPPQTLSEARQIDGATRRASAMYGVLPGDSPFYARSQYQSGVEGLHLSQDAFDYATFLDRQGGQVKSAAVGSSMATATRLTAESLGVLLHAVSHQSRLQAKQLEIQSTQNIEGAAKEEARREGFKEAHDAIERNLRNVDLVPLNSFRP